MPLCRKYIPRSKSINFVDVTVYEVLLLSRPPENFSIPMVLIQDVDAIPFLQFIFHQQKYVDVSGALFGITKTKEIIPNPKVCFKFPYLMILITFLYLLHYIFGFFSYTYSIQFICDTDANEKCIPADNILGGNKDIKGIVRQIPNYNEFSILNHLY